MSVEDVNRRRIIGLRLTVKEYTSLEGKWKESGCRKLSDYVRRLIFNKPVVRTYRNRSMDDLMVELMQLRKELNAIGVNFNQAVHRLHTLDHLPQMKRWLEGFEAGRDELSGQVKEIRDVIQKLGKQWLR